MGFLAEGLSEALRLILSGDAQVFGATGRTLWISLSAVSIATLLGLPFGALLALRQFPGRQAVLLLSRAAMAVPTVFLGIFCYGLLSRQGPLGPLDLLYSPSAIIMGETLLALPILIALSHGALAQLDPRIIETAKTLGAPWPQRMQSFLSEARTGILLAVLTAFARCSTELGIALMVGGNIKDRTRTLSTATALETGKGEFAIGLAMGLILLGLALGVTLFVGMLGKEHREGR